jgi:hypothetical protein
MRIGCRAKHYTRVSYTRETGFQFGAELLYVALNFVSRSRHRASATPRCRRIGSGNSGRIEGL